MVGAGVLPATRIYLGRGEGGDRQQWDAVGEAVHIGSWLQISASGVLQATTKKVCLGQARVTNTAVGFSWRSGTR